MMFPNPDEPDRHPSTNPNPQDQDNTPPENRYLLQRLRPQPLRPLQNYPVSAISQDLGELETTIGGLTQRHHSCFQSRQYAAASLLGHEVCDLKTVYALITHGEYAVAGRYMDQLDDVLKPYLPARLYEQMPR